MCNNKCNGNCNRCEVVCDPCKKQPKIYYCGADIACVGVTKGEEISRAIKKIGDKLCQTVNQQNPLTYVNITDATEEQCETGGFVVQILQVGSDNLVSEHILCNGGDFVTTENIVCGTDIVVEEGFGTQRALENITRYFCERVNTEPTIAEDITCGEDVVVEEDTNIPTAISDVVAYFCERVGNCIPIPGTDVGNPVTGDIEMTLFKGFKWVDDNGDLNRLTFEDGIFQISTYDSDMNFIRAVAIGSSGVVSTEYFQPDPLFDGKPFVQQKYVDTAMIPLDYGDIVSAGGIENAQVYTTGAGTGIASVDLSPIMAIGKDITVSDLGNDASNNNIQIDAGVGNTILYNGTASQDITLNTNGASVTIRRMTATQFMIIAKN